MTIGLQDLADNSVADRNFRKVDRLAIDTGGQSLGIRVGANSVVFTAAAALSADLTVTHGLGRTPVSVQCTSQQNGITMTAKTFTSTTFIAVGFYAAGATGTFPFTWQAVG